MTKDQATAIMTEAKALLDTIGDDGEVVLTAEHDGVAAIVGMVELVEHAATQAHFYRQTVQGMLAAQGGDDA